VSIAARKALNPDRLNTLTRALHGYVERGELPGILSLIWHQGEVRHTVLAGWRDIESSTPIDQETIFRIASMTKPVTSVAALILVEEGKLRLDDPVGRWLPELSEMKVIRLPGASVSDSRPATRSILVRDLLTHRAGFTLPYLSSSPLDHALRQFNDGFFPQGKSDDWIRRLGGLPLLFDPGSEWSYGFSMDVLGVLVERVLGRPFGSFLSDRLFQPLGMADTAFSVPRSKLGRLASLYERGAEDAAPYSLKLADGSVASRWGREPEFASGGAGLVSTAGDYLKFARMLMQRGKFGNHNILSAKSVELMTTNHITRRQMKNRYFGDTTQEGDAFGLGLDLVQDLAAQDRYSSFGAFYMGGAYGTYCYISPSDDLIIITMTQLVSAHRFVKTNQDSTTLTYQALDNES